MMMTMMTCPGNRRRAVWVTSEEGGEGRKEDTASLTS